MDKKIESSKEFMEYHLTCGICYTLIKSPILNKCGHRFCAICYEEISKNQNPKCSFCAAELDKKYQIKDENFENITNLYVDAQNHMEKFENRKGHELSILEFELKDYIQKMLDDHYFLYKKFSTQHENALKMCRDKADQLRQNAMSDEEKRQIQANHSQEIKAINAHAKKLIENFCAKYTKYLEDRQIPLLTKDIKITFAKKQNHIRLIINGTDKYEDLIKKIEEKLGSKLKLNEPNTILCFRSTENQSLAELTAIFDKYTQTDILPGNVDEVKNEIEPLTSKYLLKENSQFVFFGEVDY